MVKRRRISTHERAAIFAREEGVCHLCGGRIDGTREAWEVSHDIPLELGGDDYGANLRVAHAKCHRYHTATVDAAVIAKAKRREANHTGARAKSRRRLPGSRDSRWKQKVGGGWEPRW